ncbi:MAG: orotate phosphoribosyltransferase [Candidatus Latescibacteria bacterium]|nr:orotate phosphoribosyltransferase [Candidatus Latescibacterota bacterium]
MRRTIANLLLNSRAVTINVEAPYHYRSGMLSPIYCDNRLLISHPDEREAVVDGLVGVIQAQGLDPEVIAGTATAAIPFAAWVAWRLRLPMIYVRSGQKSYGKGRQIEGELPAGARVVFTEDLVTTGGGVLDSIKDVRTAGGVVSGVVTVFEYGLPAALEAFRKNQVCLWSLSDFVTVLDVIGERGDLTDEEREIALGWKADPDGWGRKMGYE